MGRTSLLAFLFVIPIHNLAGAVKTQTVHFQSGPETASGYLALPESPGPHPALVVIQEWWGLNDWVKEQAQEFAEHGYVALAPDLYHGQVATTPDEARKLSQSMPRDRAVRDLKAAFDFLSARSDVEKSKIGSVGWCMGGGLSLQLAIHQPKLAACVVNYGELPTSPEEIQKINPPVLGNFGGKDRGITPEKVHAFEQQMKSAGKQINVKIYPDAGHAFENPNNKSGYRAADAADARARTLSFLGQGLH